MRPASTSSGTHHAALHVLVGVGPGFARLKSKPGDVTPGAHLLLLVDHATGPPQEQRDEHDQQAAEADPDGDRPPKPPPPDDEAVLVSIWIPS